MDPHVRAVLRSDAVAKPFMRAFVHDDEIEASRNPLGRMTHIAVFEMIAVSDGSLILDPRIQRLYQLVAILGEWVIAEIVRKCVEHVLHLPKLTLGLVQ